VTDAERIAATAGRLDGASLEMFAKRMGYYYDRNSGEVRIDEPGGLGAVDVPKIGGTP
jgi:hypothetical protein